jgi:RNA polymerase Rpb8
MTDFLSSTFSVTSIDPQGKKFEKVSRLQARSSDLNILLELDFNNELIAISPGDEISFFLSFSDKGVESSYSYAMKKFSRSKRIQIKLLLYTLPLGGF